MDTATMRPATDGALTVELLARLEALTTRLDRQAAEIARLTADNVAHADEIARLRAAPPAGTASGAARAAELKVGRRGLIRKIVGATAVAALLTVAKEAGTARADARATILTGGGSTSQYGMLAAYGAGYDPVNSLPNLNGFSFGVIGTNSLSGIATPLSAGVFGSGGISAGVLGLSASSIGVFGQTNTVNTFGVKGVAGSEGVYPNATAGVWGTAANTNGVVGSSTNVSGVFGVAGGAGPGLGRPGGVVGTSINDYGVFGTSANYIGVYGQSTNNHGCGGTSGAAGYSGLFGFTAVPGAAALLGVSGAANGTAGYFHGAVFVDGSFQVANGPKNALVAHPDGSHRRMYCQESPEPWFEDFGTATLQNGRATVRLDPDFAAVVKADQYSVFPIPEGECKGLYVTAKTPASFEVRELQGGTSSIPFGYRLVARRKDDVGRRMEKVELPTFDLRDPSANHPGGGRPSGTER